ncbi:MAG: PilZ domain-containing protein [Bdellovibrionales bacterium]|nr:PilZ domain-containing protein [Bdellovibrionales bacterium]
MPSRPRIFAFLALIFMLIATSMPLQIMMLYNHNLQDLNLVFNKISTLNLLVVFCLVLNIPLLLKASPMLRTSLPLTFFVIAWNNYVVSSFAQDYSLTTTTLSSLGFALLFTPFFAQKYRHLFNNPHLRWWLRSPRVKTSLHTLVQPHVGSRWITELFDISETGIGVPVHNLKQSPLKIGDLTSLNIRLSQFKNLKCEAEIVRLAPANGQYPAGMGLRFLGLPPKMRNELKHFINANI